jgi:hypothetical protein
MVKADLADDGTIGLTLGPSVAAGFIHLVIAVPAELDGVSVASFMDRTGDATEP